MVCSVDNDPLWLNEEGEIKCTSGSHSGKVNTWRWNCGSSYHNGESLRADLQGFAFALATSSRITNEAGSEWFASLTSELGKQYA